MMNLQIHPADARRRKDRCKTSWNCDGSMAWSDRECMLTLSQMTWRCDAMVREWTLREKTKKLKTVRLFKHSFYDTFYFYSRFVYISLFLWYISFENLFSFCLFVCFTAKLPKRCSGNIQRRWSVDKCLLCGFLELSNFIPLLQLNLFTHSLNLLSKR